MAKDPTAVAQKWAQNLAASTQAITDGVNAVTTAPGQAAARQKAVYINNVTASANKWATNVAAVPLSDWQASMINKGVPRVASGAQAAQPKMQAFMSKLLPYVASGVNSLPPRGDINANIARMTQWVQYMAKFSN
jgi:hypothetical protein